mmetsp:Transcript_59725/g.142104  ORF Transcript_59725/g.142104 Transcript_59725/m.142104 type:complete len:246 (+) Transcript_59725:72-809(+)
MTSQGRRNSAPALLSQQIAPVQLPPLKYKQPRRSVAEPGTCRRPRDISIDALTLVPGDLYMDLLQAGEKARNRGRHVLTLGARGRPTLRHVDEGTNGIESTSTLMTVESAPTPQIQKSPIDFAHDKHGRRISVHSLEEDRNGTARFLGGAPKKEQKGVTRAMSTMKSILSRAGASISRSVGAPRRRRSVITSERQDKQAGAAADETMSDLGIDIVVASGPDVPRRKILSMRGRREHSRSLAFAGA